MISLQMSSGSHTSHNLDAESYLCGEDDSACQFFIFLVPTSWLIAPPVSSCHFNMVRSKDLTPLKPSDKNVPTFKPQKWSILLYNRNAI